MMEFKALRVPALSQELAAQLEAHFKDLPGIERFTIALETQELDIVFDDAQLDFRVLAQEMARLGCPWRNINAALLKPLTLARR